MSSILKVGLHESITNGLYNEIVNKQARYYYFLGRTLAWDDEANQPLPVDSAAYDRSVRNTIITLKAITPVDVAFVVPRYNWTINEVYDQYDDEYSTEVLGINLLSGGTLYATSPYVYIGSVGSTAWLSETSYISGQLVYVGSNYYIVTVAGTSSTTALSHTSGSAVNGSATFLWVSVIDGGGTGATATATVLDGSVIDITITNRGIGYTSIPSVIIAGGGGSESTASAVVNISYSGNQKIDETLFYVVTDEYNVYMCLDNNNNSISEYKPFGTTVDSITLLDGYIWKFLYNIPIALRNKFLTETHMPVVTALSNQFYSNGDINIVRVDSPGTGYTTANVTIIGDGYLESDPTFISSYTISNAGTGYTSATIEIDPPFPDAFTWISSSSYILGQLLDHNGNIYKVVVSGITDTFGPSHQYGTVANGTAALKYLGTTATGIVSVGAGLITGVTLYGMLRSVTIVDGGSGYISVPTVNITSGGGTGAQATAILQNGTVRNVVVHVGGSDYTSNPTITFGDIWVTLTAVALNDQIYYADRLYTVTIAGTTGATAPVHTSGTAVNGGATLEYVGVAASGTAAIKYGAGYSTTPIVTVSGPGSNGEIYLSTAKSEAVLIPILSGGQISSIQIDDGGIGYSTAILGITGDGTDASVSVEFSPGNINSLQADIELLTVSGGIMNIPVVSGGYAYGSATVTIVGDGTGCTATPVIVNGIITKITVNNYGSGYNWATATVSGSGFGAKLRPIISSYGGHGKYATRDLYARTLMFYTSISSDKIQGFDINNDYRQLGIIKSPKEYGTAYSLTSALASACWVISVTNDPLLFPEDSLIYLVTDNSPRFRIIVNTGEAMLLVAIDNGIPIIGSTFVNSDADSFTTYSVTEPSVDKYSGDCLFIDNKQAFTATDEQSVSLRTIIKF